MPQKTLEPQRRRERGQTMIFVALSLVSLLAMAALAIDIVTLYVSSSEIQRAADASALAGAKAIADSGITSLLLTDANFSTIQTWADTVKNKQIDAVLTNNPVAGQKITIVSATVDWGHQGDPRVTVILQRDGLPTFFSKIWNRTGATVKATAVAEAYNPANQASMTPIAPQSVKPWLVANASPTTGTAIVTVGSGAVDSSVVGKTFDLVSDCKSAGSCAPPWIHTPPGMRMAGQVDYLPALVTAPGAPNPNICPACAGATDYENSIECADVTTSYKVLSCGGGGANIQWDPTTNPGDPTQGGNNATALGAECLIHASGTGNAGQDTINNPGTWPSGPVQFKAQSGPQNGNLVTTSNSIATIPIFDSSVPINPFGGPVTIVGFLQAFIKQVDAAGGPGTPPAGSINITVLNIVGCGADNGANPVVGVSGTSPIPVRLITPP